MKRALAIITIILLLIVGGVIEVVNVTKIIHKLQADVLSLETLIDENKNDLPSITEKVLVIKSNWEKKEVKLCLMFNHKDLSIITDAVNKLHTNVILNDYDNTLIEINLLKAYSKNSTHVMGYNFQNVF